MRQNRKIYIVSLFNSSSMSVQETLYKTIEDILKIFREEGPISPSQYSTLENHRQKLDPNITLTDSLYMRFMNVVDVAIEETRKRKVLEPIKRRILNKYLPRS